MKKFKKTFLLTLTTICMAICFVFSGCAAKYAGTYKYVDGDTTYKLKISTNKEFTFEKAGANESTKKNGTWAIKEEAEDVLVLTIGSSSLEVECDGEKLVVEVLESAILDSGLALDIGFDGSANFVK